MRYSLLIAIALSATACTPKSASFWFEDAGFDQLEAEDYNAEKLLVGLHAGERATPQFNRDTLVELKRWDALDTVVVSVPQGEDALWMAAEMMASGDYAYVEPDYTRSITSVNDTYRSYQWHLDSINMDTAWLTSTGSGAVVAVIDTGVGTGGTDTPSLTSNGYDFVDNDSNPADGNGHGTHVAGTVAQASNNNNGVAGVAYDAQVMAVRVLNNFGSGSSSDVIDGILHAADNGADVINMSLGSSSGSTSEQSAVNYAANAGVAIFAASGNAGATSVDYPARYSEVIAVGATRYDNNRASYSNRGSDLDIVAPGGDTSVDQNGDGYVDGVLQETNDGGSSYGYYFYQGTSMAAPHAAGVAALLVSLGADRDEVRQVLRDTAVDLGSTGFDTSYGYGLIDAAAAVAAVGVATDDDADGWTTADGDCDDTDASVNPGATEDCYNGVDNDCSGVIDDGMDDFDGDGYVDDFCAGGDDCDDGDNLVNPGELEVCGDGIDNDCSGSDEVCAVDNDSDGYDSDVDCDDSDASVNPGAFEDCFNGVDDDCSGVIDDGFEDFDGDGYADDACAGGQDCDDSDEFVNPGETEICEDGIDQDCDGLDDFCSTAPSIINVSWSTRGRNLTVEWETDEPTTGEACNARGDCDTTARDTVHAVTIRKKGGSFSITATDDDGDTDSYGPQAY